MDEKNQKNGPKGLTDVREALIFFAEKYRHPDLKTLEISKLYSLFPEEKESLPPGVEKKWPDQWPNADMQGVYLILDDDLHLLYIGKASWKNTLGNRLSSYFHEDKEKKDRCVIIHNWSKRPQYVATIPVEESFEAPALEEFLILELQPPDNGIK